MANPNKPGSANRPNRDAGTQQGQPEFEPVEQSADAELEEAEKEESEKEGARIEAPGAEDDKVSPVQVSGEDVGDENGEMESDLQAGELGEEDDQSLGGLDPNQSKRRRQDSDRLRP